MDYLLITNKHMKCSNKCYTFQSRQHNQQILESLKEHCWKINYMYFTFLHKLPPLSPIIGTMTPRVMAKKHLW